MKVKEIINILNAAIPVKETWSKGESYGGFGIKNVNAEVKRILYCVTPTYAGIDYFNEHKYDLLISHHPFVKNGVPMLVYHTALDCCKNGLNDMWKDYLEVKDAKHFDANLGWYGKIDPIPFNDLVAKVETFVGAKVKGLIYHNKKKPLVDSVVICTGLGGLVFGQAELTNADVYITGELTHPSHGHFNGIIEVGHTLTEVIGIKLFRDLLPGIQIDPAPLSKDVFGSEVCLTLEGALSWESKDSALTEEEEDLMNDTIFSTY